MELANPYSFNSLFNAANFEGATKTETIMCETQQEGLLPARKKYFGRAQAFHAAIIAALSPHPETMTRFHLATKKLAPVNWKLEIKAFGSSPP